MSPVHHRHRFPIPSHSTVLPVAIADFRRASLFSVSSVRHLSALCVKLFPLPTLCFHQLTNCLSLNSCVFKSFCVALCALQISAQKEIKMTHSAPKPSFINNSARCVHF